MATYYVDYEGEAGSGDGSSFANRAKRLNSLSSVNPGDEVRIKQTSNPTVLGTGKVVKDFGGTASYNPPTINSSAIYYSTTTGQTYWMGIPNGWKTGDVVVFSYHQAPAGQNLNGAWRLTVDRTQSPAHGYFDGFTASSTASVSNHNFKYQSATANSVILSGSSSIKEVAGNDAARSTWTGTTGCNTAAGYESSHSDWRSYDKWQLPTGSDHFTISTSASTGKIAHYQLDSALDLSDFQQISFWLQTAGGNSNLTGTEFFNGTANNLSLRLCTDTAGNTSVHTIPLNNGYTQNNRYNKVLKDFGANLNSSINSVALYLDSALVSDTQIRIHHIIASKASSSADSVNLTSMIGLNTTADKVWYPIAYIHDRGDHSLIVLDTWCSARGVNGWGYYGNYISAWWSQTFNSTTIYKREQVFPKYIREGYQSSSNSGDPLYRQGNISNSIEISGGWNSTDMSTQVGETFIRGAGNGRGMDISSNYQAWSKLFYNNFDHNKVSGIYGVSLDNMGFCTTYSNAISLNSYTPKKLNINYAYGSYGTAVYTSGLDNQGTYNTNYTDFNIHYMASGQTLGRPFQCYHMKYIHWNLWNSECTCSDGTMIDTGSENLIFETIKTGYSTGAYGLRIYDSSHSCKNIRIKNLYNFATSYGLELYSNGRNFSIDNFVHQEYYDSDTYMQFTRFSYAISQSYCMWAKNDSELKINGGSTANKLALANNATVKSIGLDFSSATNSNLATSPIQGLGGTGWKYLAKDFDNVSGEVANIFAQGQITPETSIRHTASGYSWKFSGQSGGISNLHNLEIGKVIVNGGSAVTISVWAYKNATSGSGPTGVLTVLANTDIGISSDQTADTSSISDQTWTKITVTFTPTAAGIVSVLIGSYDGHKGQMYFDDVEISQA